MVPHSLQSIAEFSLTSDDEEEGNHHLEEELVVENLGEQAQGESGVF